MCIAMRIKILNIFSFISHLYIFYNDISLHTCIAFKLCYEFSYWVVSTLFIFWIQFCYYMCDLQICFSSLALSFHKSESVSLLVTRSCPTLCNPMDCSLPGPSLHGIFQARILEWVAITFSSGSSLPRDPMLFSLITWRIFKSELYTHMPSAVGASM